MLSQHLYSKLPFFLFFFFILSCHQQKQTATSVITKDTTAYMNTQPDKYRKQLEAGIDFLASGTEPFWSLEINFDRSMHFKTAGGIEIITPVGEGVKAMDAPVIRYTAATEKGSLIVQLKKWECTNAMSGEKLPYQVSVDVKDSMDNSYTHYEGCGQYLYDYRLNDIWVLESINNQKLSPSEFSKGLPQLEINRTQQKIFGHTGCNNITGPIELQGKRLHIGPLAGTRMACPNLEFENKYLNSLSNRTLAYRIESLKLHLQISKDSTFTYKKAD